MQLENRQEKRGFVFGKGQCYFLEPYAVRRFPRKKGDLHVVKDNVIFWNNKLTFS